MLKTCCFLTPIFSGFGLDLGGSWASKSAALLAAPGVLDATAFYACINILLFLPRGGETFKMEPKPPHVGAMLALCWLIFRSWVAFCVSCAPLNRFFGAFGSSWPLLLRLGALRDRFWRVQGRSGDGFWMYFHLFSDVFFYFFLFVE